MAHVQAIRYNGIEMPTVRIVNGSTCVVVGGWHIAVNLADGRRFELWVADGFAFDGASIPRLLWLLCGHPLEAPRIAAALAHDWLYAAQIYPRADADLIYREICRAVGIGAVARTVEHGALRACGWIAWRGHTDDDRVFALTHGSAQLLPGEIV